MKGIPTETRRELIGDIKSSKAKQAELLSSISTEGEVLEVVSIDEINGLRMTFNNGNIVH